jgi:hypothetical protein
LQKHELGTLRRKISISREHAKEVKLLKTHVNMRKIEEEEEERRNLKCETYIKVHKA